MNASMVLALVAVLIPAISAQTRSSAVDLDQKVQAYLEAQKSLTRAGHFSDSDGRLIYDMILKNKYTRAVDIGTGTGQSAIWMAWALSKTGGKLITIEIDETRYRAALARFQEAGLAPYIDARLADALKLLPQLSGPFDFVFMDAPTVYAREFFDSVARQLVVGGRYLTHGVRGDGDLPEYFGYLKSLKNFETTFNTGGEFSVTTKTSER
jgi:predicted O-methyltransferase YrrM